MNYDEIIQNLYRLKTREERLKYLESLNLSSSQRLVLYEKIKELQEQSPSEQKRGLLGIAADIITGIGKGIARGVGKVAKGVYEWAKELPPKEEETAGEWVQRTIGEPLKGVTEWARKTAVVPLTKVSEGLGISMALPSIKRMNEEILQRELEMQDRLLKAYREARASGDTEKVEKYKKLLSEFKFTEALGEVLREAPTPREIVADAVYSMLWTAMGYNKYLPSELSFKIASPTALAEARAASILERAIRRKAIEELPTAPKLLEKFAKPTLKAAARGASFFGIAEARERDATIDDIIRSMETGAVFFGGTTLAGITAAETIKLASNKLGNLFTQIEKKLYEIGYQPKYKTVSDAVAATYGEQPFTQRLAQKAFQFTQQIHRLEQRFVERTYPFKRIENALLKTLGRPLKERERIWMNSRLLLDIADAKAEVAITKFKEQNKNILENPELFRKAWNWLTQLDYIERAKLGLKVPGNKSLETLIAEAKQLAKEIGVEDLKQIAVFRRNLQNLFIEYLDKRIEAGIITPKTKELLLQTHPNYIPHRVLIEMDEMVAKTIGMNYNVPQSDIVRAVGSAKEIQHPWTAIVHKIVNAERLIAKNQLLNDLVNLQEQYGIVTGMTRLKSGAVVPEGFGTISLFRNGVKETWMVPKDIEIAVKNTDSLVLPNWFEFLTKPVQLFKKSATQYNLSFALPNKIKDINRASFTSAPLLQEMIERYGITDKEIKLLADPEKIKELYKLSGGFGASIFREGETRVAQKLVKSGIAKIADEKNPIALIGKINEEIELSTRLNAFRTALAAGLDPKTAAFYARNVTVDFGKMGTWMAWLNRAIPFLNARVQGIITLGDAYFKDPENFMRVAQTYATLPTLLLHAHNRRFRSYRNVSGYFKDNYFVIMTGEYQGTDPITGEPIWIPQFISIPKSEIQILLSAPVQFVLDRLEKIDKKKVTQMLADLVSDVSPIEFYNYDSGRGFGKAISQLGPIPNIAVGLLSNVEPFTGKYIVPPERLNVAPYLQYRRTTPQLIKDVAKILNVSPAKIEFVLNAFGGMTQDMMNGLDIAYGIVRENKIGGEPINETLYAQMRKVPVLRRFFREITDYWSEERVERRKMKEEITTDVKTARTIILDKVKAIEQELKKRKTNEERLRYLNSISDELTPEIRQELVKRLKRERTFEELDETDLVEVRAVYLAKRLEELKEMGASKEELIEFLNEAENRGILTPQVKQEMWLILKR